MQAHRVPVRWLTTAKTILECPILRSADAPAILHAQPLMFARARVVGANRRFYTGKRYHAGSER
jgi:hypothetical protein